MSLVSSDGLEHEERIVWVRDPREMEYVREKTGTAGTRTQPYPKHRVGAGELVGYAVLTEDAPNVGRPGTFERRYFTLKDHDRPQSGDTYESGTPAEGVDPLTIFPGVAGKATLRSENADQVVGRVVLDTDTNVSGDERNESSGGGYSGPIPIVTSEDEKTDLWNEHNEESEPFIWVNMIRGRTWCFLVVDLEVTVRDWDAGFRTGDALTSAAVDRVNEICDRYESAVRPRGSNHLSMGALSTSFGATYMTFPDMRPEDAGQFGEELAEVVMDRDNRGRKDELEGGA